MRIKIVAVNALVVALVGLLSFLLVRAALGSATGNKDQATLEAQKDANGAAGRLQLDGLRTERWLAAAAGDQATLDALQKASPAARGDAATKRCDDLVSKMKSEPLFEKNVPTLVMLVDAGGKIVGRNGTNMNRGDDMAGTYSGLKSTLLQGQSGSDIWYERDRYLGSYAAVRDSTGTIVGALLAGRPLNDTLSRASEATTGRALDVVVPQGDKFVIVGHSAIGSKSLDDAVDGVAKDMLKDALAHGQTDGLRDGDQLVAASPLPALGDGRRALLVAVAPASLIADPSGLALLPILGATAIGIVLVIVGGWLLGNYITRPINMLEEGLLAILNGQTDKRFELDHAELGGLAFRIDQLLNQLMGVEEDTTDEEGRVSHAPTTAHFNDALAVDDKHAGGELDPEAIRRLAVEEPDPYYERLYREYVAAKRAIGEPTDHITLQAFVTRIQGMEAEASQKHGQRVRYQVQARNKEVVLLAVPLPEGDRRATWLPRPMGLFDSVQGGDRKGHKSNPASKWADRVEKRAQNYDRQEAIQALAEMGTADAVEVLLKRFTFHIDPSITDQEEKDSAFRGILRADKSAIEPVRAFAAKAESLAWPMKIMKELVDDEEYTQELLRWLARWDTEYSKFVDPKVQILTALEDRKQPGVREQVERFLDDVHEPSRFHAASTLLAQQDEAAAPALARLLGAEESVRVRTRIAEGLASQGWTVPQAERDAVRKSLPAAFLLDDGGRIVKR